MWFPFCTCRRDVEEALKRIERRLDRMSVQLDRLTSEVAENSIAVDSAIVLLNRLAQMIRDSVDDPAALEALANDIDAKTNALAAAVVANTPAEPAPEPEPVG